MLCAWRASRPPLRRDSLGLLDGRHIMLNRMHLIRGDGGPGMTAGVIGVPVL